MLAGVGRLVERHRRFSLDQENIEVLGQQNGHRFPHGSDDPAFHMSIESTILRVRSWKTGSAFRMRSLVSTMVS